MSRQFNNIQFEEKGKLVCDVCGCEFGPTKEGHYLSRDDDQTGLFSNIAPRDEVNVYDTFDCPNCGCQKIIQKRKRPYFVYVSEEVEESEDESSEDTSEEHIS